MIVITEWMHDILQQDIGRVNKDIPPEGRSIEENPEDYTKKANYLQWLRGKHVPHISVGTPFHVAFNQKPINFKERK